MNKVSKLYAAVVAALLLTLGAPSAGVYIYENYTFVDGSVISNSTMEKIETIAKLNAMAGYMAGRKACNSDT